MKRTEQVAFVSPKWPPFGCVLSHQLVDSEEFVWQGHGNLGGRVSMLTALTSPHLVDKMVVESATPLNTEALLKTYETYRQACYIYRVQK